MEIFLRILKASFFALILVIIIFIIIYVGVHIKFRKVNMDCGLKNTPMVWAHRVIYFDTAINVLNDNLYAFGENVNGIEIDIYFDSEISKFIVSHAALEDKNILKLPLLEDIIKLGGGDFYYWVDFKNLSTENVEKSIIRLLYLIEKYNLKDKLYIESQKAKSLKKISKAGIKTIFWLKYIDIFFVYPQLLYIKYHIITSDFDAISTPYEVIDKPSFQRNFTHLPVFTFTVNDKSSFDSIFEKPYIKVILTDNAGRQ